ncbi:GNAT family N-acetyltransferase [Nocardia heshunensis]
MAVYVRRATPEDAEALTALLVELHDHYGRPDPKLVWVRVHKAYFRMGEAAWGPLIAFLDGVPVGFAYYDTTAARRDKPRYSAIQEFIVTAGARGLGIGRALFEAVSAHAAERGSRHVVLGMDSNPRDLNPFELSAVLDDEVYAYASRLPRGPDLAVEERRRQVREVAVGAGWEPPVVVDRRREIFDFSVGDVLAEGHVPFAILSDGRAVRAHFRTTWVSSAFGEDEDTTWCLTLDGKPISSALQIYDGWARGATMPHRTHPHPSGGEAVHYDFYYGHHLATVSGTIEYIFDAPTMRVRTIEHLETDTSQ